METLVQRWILKISLITKDNCNNTCTYESLILMPILLVFINFHPVCDFFWIQVGLVLCNSKNSIDVSHNSFQLTICSWYFLDTNAEDSFFNMVKNVDYCM